MCSYGVLLLLLLLMLLAHARKIETNKHPPLMVLLSVLYWNKYSKYMSSSYNPTLLHLIALRKNVVLLLVTKKNFRLDAVSFELDAVIFE